MNLLSLFNLLGPPNETVPYQFTAIPIPHFENYRIAKDSSLNPSLLVVIASPEKRKRFANIKLKNIAVEYDQEYSINQDEVTIVTTFTVISYIGEDTRLKEYFLDLCSILIRNIGTLPSRDRIRFEVEKLVEIFRCASLQPLKTIQGLWGELLLINESNNPLKLLKHWRLLPEERYDFSNGEEKIEVKTSSSTERIHYFSLEQLNPPIDSKLLVVSIIVKKSAAGKNINTLLNEISDKIGEKDIIDRLKFQILLTLGESILTSSNYIFDYVLAKDSIAFFHAEDVPSILLCHIPEQITEVKFRSKLNEEKRLKVEEVRNFGELFRMLI